MAFVAVVVDDDMSFQRTTLNVYVYVMFCYYFLTQNNCNDIVDVDTMRYQLLIENPEKDEQ